MITITGSALNLEDFIRAVRYHEPVCLAEIAKEAICRSHAHIKDILASGRKVYGINTGFGKLSDVLISPTELNALQHNLLKSHACGVGPYFDEETVRGMMILRVNALAKGFSGIRLEVIEKLLEYLNHGLIPAIPEQGSLGASGDLAPLSHLSLTLLGEGEVFYHQKLMDSKKALQEASVLPLDHLEAKEGLSLINGTQAMTSVGAIALYDALALFDQANIAAALTLEALSGIRDAFSEAVHLARGQLGQIRVARTIRNLTEGSTYMSGQGELRVQDPYSLRCIAQVHGACFDALEYIREKTEIEMNAATDNPLVFNSNTVISGGNFHGEPMALVFDFLKIAVSELADISERRIERLVNPQLNCGLPPFLAMHPGINSGFMIVQYSAASLVSENKVLAHPASVDSIPSSGNQEDHVSMGTIAARGARDILANSTRVIAMELMTAAQALGFREKKQLGRGTDAAYRAIREIVPFLTEDTIMYPYLRKMETAVKERTIFKKTMAV